ncbi:MAG: glycosyltransferase, partial [Oscillospiraceae bacterium]
MNILVLDVAASESGALSILQEYYRNFKIDHDNQYLFCISTPELCSTNNIQVLSFPWVKKSWFHRIWFEVFYVNKIVKQFKIDRVFSLENLILSNPKCEKWIYLHMAVPFIDVRFSIMQDPLMWVYQNIMDKFIISSLRNADKIIVQTQWMKDACIKVAHLQAKSVTVQPPQIQESEAVHCVKRSDVRNTLFYPATALNYKNHFRLLSALKQMQNHGTLGDLCLNLTLSGDENTLAKKLFSFVADNHLPVKFLGKLPKAQVVQLYASSTLIFPSYVETFGLPLLEARKADTLILASNCSFSREILSDYDAVTYFNPLDTNEICATIEKHLSIQATSDRNTK